MRRLSSPGLFLFWEQVARAAWLQFVAWSRNVWHRIPFLFAFFQPAVEEKSNAAKPPTTRKYIW